MVRFYNPLIIIYLSFPILLFSQGRPYEGPIDPAGDISQVRVGYLNGNRVIMPFENTSTLGRVVQSLSSRWPNSYEGTQMTDNITVMIGSEVYIYQDSIPVTDMTEVARLSSIGEIDTLFFIQGNDPERNDHNYYHTIDWAMYPVSGYFNEAQDYLAQSNKPESWPPEGWPSTGFEKKWQGEWNGRFGRGVLYADLEAYFVANDAQDLEYIVQIDDPKENLITDGPRYHPRPGIRIGDINPDVTIQKGYPWGGLGLRVALRCYQWNNPEAQDMIFMEYEVSNISEYDLPTSGFGLFVDGAVGGEHSPDGDMGYYNKDLDMAFGWDYDGVGIGGYEPGTMGLAFLESPGRAYDNIDNDNDGLLDEKRDNPAGELIGPTDGIYNLSDFLDFYHLKLDDLHDHYEGDEDQDWDDGNDANNNGTYAYRDVFGSWHLEPGEYAGDDVGLDGVGPGELNYFGPDEGECNHRPDFVEGLGCEPDFATTDVTESDMLGLTSFNVFDYYRWVGNDWQIHDDKNTWNLMKSTDFRVLADDLNSVYFIFSSASFPFYKGRTERISMTMLFAYESLANLNSPEHYTPNLKTMKEVAQVIYERDYRFAQPPLMPTLTANVGDGKVILTWNDVADQLTREPFLGNINDFEGYKVYRATDKLMSDAEVITDGKGTAMFKKPIYQCDLVDSIEGYADFGLVGGTAYYLGDETGITHYFVDENVQNGRTYYYAVVAYDYGAKDIGGGISPTENSVVIELDEAEEVVRKGENVAVVTPGQRAAGYTPPNVSFGEQIIKGSASVSAEVVALSNVKQDHTYNVVFHVDTVGYHKTNVQHHHMDIFYINNGFSVYDQTEGNKLVYSESPEYHASNNVRQLPISGIGVDETAYCINPMKEIVTDIFDGIQLKINMPFISAEFDSINSGWLVGSSPINVTVSQLAESYFPWQYEIIFTGDSAYTTQTTRTTSFKDLNLNIIEESELILDYAFPFYVINKHSIDSTGAYEKLDLVVHDVNSNAIFERDTDYVLVGHMKDLSTGQTKKTFWSGSVFAIDFFNVRSETEMPQADDIYRVDFKRPFVETDTLKINLNLEQVVDREKLADTMDKIKVVPNPYIMTNSMETAVSNRFLNQRRRLMFTHIPARCEIRIFTSSGVLVDKIDVENEPSNGIVHWDLLSKEDLEIAAGMYVYHVRSKEIDKEKVGLFAVIK